jgi:hypothetical protein
MDALLIIIIVIVLVVLAVYARQYVFGGRSPRPYSGGADDLSVAIPQIVVLEAIFPLMDKYHTSQRSKVDYSGNKGERAYYTPIFDKLDIRVSAYKNFMDICCNPGALSMRILEDNKDITGYGLSLPVNKSGYPESPELKAFKDRFKVYNFDVLEDDSATLPTAEVDFACISCFPKHNKNADAITMKLFARAFTLAIDKFHSGSDLFWVHPFRWSANILLNTLKLLREHFHSVEFCKDEVNSPGLAVAYIMSKNFKSKDSELIDKYAEGEQLFDAALIDMYGAQINEFMKSLAKHHIDLIN